MAYVLETTVITINGVDYTSLARKIELQVQADEKDVTTFIALGAKEVISGQESGSVKVDVNITGALSTAMWALFKGKQPVPFTTRVSADAISATNPEFSGKVLINKWSPISGSPGDVWQTSLDMPTSGPTEMDITP